MFPKTTPLVVSAVVASVLVGVAQAEFINGVERFDGTSKDLATWEEYLRSPASITQDDALTLTGEAPTRPADFTTKVEKLAVGGSVRAEVTVNWLNGGSGGLLLTTNSGGTTDQAMLDSFAIGLEATSASGSFDAKFTCWQMQNGGGGGNPISSLVPQIGTTYIFEMERLASDYTRFSVYNAEGSLLGERPQQYHNAYAGDLYVALYVTLGSASLTFDNVQVPEPSSLVLALSGMLVLVACGWQKRRG